ncbi:MAG: DEAD/DEAH box helicase family protein [Polyangiales bacterium]
MRPAEEHLERTIVEGLVASGWIEGDPSRVDPSRALVPDDLMAWLGDAHPTQWARLSKDHGEHLAERLTRALEAELQAKNTPDVLRGGFTFDGERIELACFPPPHGRNPESVARAARNRLVVTRQAPIEPGSNKTVDLLLSLNGVPVATVELKHGPNRQDAAKAMEQYRARPTHLPIFRWPSRAVVHFAVDEHVAWMTTRVQGADTVFVPFNRGTADHDAGNPPNPDGYATDYLWKDVWTRESFLTLLQRYVHHLEVIVERDGRPAIDRRLLFPRWHQRDAVQRIMRDVEARGPGQRYLIEHSAGSGKSNTIAWLAWHLADLHDAAGALFDKVVVVTDRTVLDGQLGATIEQMTATRAKVRHVRERVREARRDRRAATADERITGGSELLDALNDQGARVVVVTVQTFLHAPDVLDARVDRSFAVILDEAHAGVGEESDKAMTRTLLGESSDDYLRDYAARRQHPNQSLFAFTATPRPETLFVYGSPDSGGADERAAFHTYTMKQAIAEGFIVDVLAGYVRYETYFRLSGVGIDDDDPEVDRRGATAAVLREVSKDEKVMGAKCKVIASHFLSKVRPALGGHGRAMVVASSRASAVRYYRRLRAELDARGARDVGVLVAFSGAVVDDATRRSVTERDLNGFAEAELPRRFASGSHRILVVANKYQTGFDQPLLCAMYIDRALEGVQAVQTLSRLNRPFGPSKRVFALDFVNDQEVPDAFVRFMRGTRLTDAPTAETLEDLRGHLDEAGVYTEAEVLEVARLALSPSTGLAEHERQEKISGVTSVARERFIALAAGAQEAFRGRLTEFLRLYALVSQVVAVPDESLEARAVFGAWLLQALPGAATTRALVDLAGRVTVDYVRLVVGASGVANQGPDADGGDADDGANDPGAMTLSTRAGARRDDPTVRLSELLQGLNDRYGFGASPEDRASVEAILAALLADDEVMDAIRAAQDPRDLARDADIQRRIRKRFRERQAQGDGFAVRFAEGDDDLRRELMELVLEIAGRRSASAAADTLSPKELAGLAELNVLRNALEPRLRAFVRRTLEGVHGERWLDAVLRYVPTEERRRFEGMDGDAAFRERLYLSTLITVIDRQWSTAFGPVLESAPTQERLSRSQCAALLEVLNAHREDAHARPIRDVDLATVRAVVGQLHRVLDRVAG